MDRPTRTVLVTGSGSGLGRATAVAFAATGANVVLADISEIGNAETLALVRETPGQGVAVMADVSRPDGVAKMVEGAIEKFGSLDVAVNNAGIEQKPQAFTDVDDATYDRVMDVNCRGVWLCMKAEIAAMLPKGRGAIVNVTSITDEVGSAGNPIYVASKHAVLGLTRSAALEYAKAGIRINAVSPAGIRTRLFEEVERSHPEYVARGMALHPIGRVATPEEVAKVIRFLASDDASYITGHSLKVDGGYTVA